MAIRNLRINLEAGTAQYDTGMDNSATKAGQTAQKIQNEFGKINFHEATGGLKLLEESLGVTLPRHLNSLIVKLPGLGTAFAEALPIAGIVIAGEKVLEFIGHLVTVTGKQDEMARKAQEVALAWQESSQKIQAEIVAQEAKILSLNSGAVAGFEYAFSHAASVVIAHLKEIDTQVEATAKHIAESSNWFTSLASGSDEAAEDLKNFNSDLQRTMVNAEENSKGDKFAAIRAGLDAAGIKADELQTKIREMHDAQTHGGQAEDVMYATKEKNYKAEAEAIDNVIRRLNQLSNLQVGTNAAHGSEDAAMRVELFNKEYAAQKAASDAKTKAVIAGYELEFTQGKITAVQLSDLKQAALDTEYEAARAHFEKLKVLDAGRSEVLKQVLAQEATLEDNHDTQVIESLNKALEANKKGRDEMLKIATEQFVAEEALRTKASDAFFKDRERKAMAIVADAALIQGEGSKKIAAIDKEIAKLKELQDKYQLVGKAQLDVQNAIHELSLKRQHDLDAEMRASQKLGEVMHGTMNEMILEGQQWKTKVADVFKQTVDGMNDNIAQLAVTGKANFAQLAQGAIESLIKIELQRMESHLLHKALDDADKETDASDAARKVFKSVFDAVPFPFNLVAAPVAAAGVFAKAMAFRDGGEVPDGAETGIPAVLHPREMVLDRALADVVRGAAANHSNGGDGSSGSRPISMTTNIHALAASAEDISAVLKPHVLRILRSEARNRYERF